MSDSYMWFVNWICIVVIFTGMVMNFMRLNDLDDISTGSTAALLAEIKALNQRCSSLATDEGA